MKNKIRVPKRIRREKKIAKQPLVSVIIVNYNDKKHLPTVLKSLKRQTYSNFETILVDNASVDNSIKLVKKNFPEVLILQSDRNLGYGGGINFGARDARGEFIAPLNPDIELDSKWLEELVRATKNFPRYGIYASKILNYFKRSLIENVGFRYTPYGTHFVKGCGEKDKGQYDYFCEVFYASGCAMFIKRKVFRKLDGFDEKMHPIYGEEDDFCWRAKLLGFKTLFVPQAIVYHVRKGTIGKASPLTFLYSRRHKIRSLIKNHDRLTLLLSLPIRLMIDFLTALLSAITLKEGGYMLSFTKTILWNITNAKNTYRERIKIQTARKMPFSEVKRQMFWVPPFVKEKGILQSIKIMAKGE